MLVSTYLNRSSTQQCRPIYQSIALPYLAIRSQSTNANLLRRGNHPRARIMRRSLSLSPALHSKARVRACHSLTNT